MGFKTNLPIEICFKICSYCDKCKFCNRYTVQKNKIYCDDKCFYLYKAKYILTFKGALVLYTIILLYGNTIGIFLSSLVLMTIIENLF